MKSSNLQSYPRQFKHLWIADPGHVLVWGDMAQIEAKLTAFFARDQERTKLILGGEDLYSHDAAALYGCEPTKAASRAMRVDFGGVKRTARDAAKTFDLAWGYGMGAETFSNKHGIPLKEARRLLDAANRRWPAIVRYRQSVALQAATEKKLETPFGWRRYFWTPYRGGDVEKWPDAREACSHLPQSSAASMFKRILTTVDPNIFWAARHDEIVLHVSEQDGMRVARDLKEKMERPFPELEWREMYSSGFWCACEIGIGKKWGRAEETIG